jgi:hypothetical protein
MHSFLPCHFISILSSDMSKICKVCEKKVEKLFSCAGKCKDTAQAAWYCSKECQVDDWKNKGHKDVCRRTAFRTSFATDEF